MSRKRFSRIHKPRRIGRTFLIVCEGKKTERGYFEGIRTDLRRATVQIKVVHPGVTDPESLVQAALRERDALTKDGLWLSDDFACAVFDGDEHLQGNRSNWDRAVDLARRKNVFLSLSNPSFELWYLLHYADQRANLNRTTAIQQLKRYLPDYEKAKKLYPTPLSPLTQDAIRRAKSLERQHEKNCCESFTNPCTYVFRVVEELFKLGKKS